MNKTYINILCVLILGLLAIKVAIPFFGIGNSVTSGPENHRLTETHTPYTAQFTANHQVPFTPTDSMTFESGENYSVIAKEINVFVPDEVIPSWIRVVSGLCHLLVILVSLIALSESIRFIININRSKIFVQDNVRRLRSFGWCLLIIGLLIIIAGLTESSLIDSLNLSYSNRSLKAAWDFPWSSLLIGFASLLMARVWARGIALREDNELTI